MAQFADQEDRNRCRRCADEYLPIGDRLAFLYGLNRFGMVRLPCVGGHLTDVEEVGQVLIDGTQPAKRRGLVCELRPRIGRASDLADGLFCYPLITHTTYRSRTTPDPLTNA
jgi:hypothetical protein